MGEPVDDGLLPRSEPPAPGLGLGWVGSAGDHQRHRLHRPHPGACEYRGDRPLDPAQHHRVCPTHGALQQPLHLRRLQGAHQCVQGQQQHVDQRLLGEHHAGLVDGDRDPVGQQRAPQCRDGTGGPDDHRDVVPGDVLADVGTPHLVGDGEMVGRHRRRVPDLQSFGTGTIRSACRFSSISTRAQCHPGRRGGQAGLQVVDGRDQGVRQPVGDRQHNPLVRFGGDPAEELLVGASEVEDTLVRVPGHEGPDAGPDEPGEERPGRRVEVVGVVHQQQPDPGGLVLQHRRCLVQGVEGDVQQLGGIEVLRARQRLDLVVLPQELPGTDPHGLVMLPPQRAQFIRPDTALGGAEQQVTQLSGESDQGQRRTHVLRPGTRAVLGVAAQQCAYLHVVLGAGHQPWQGDGVVLLCLGDRPKHGEGPGVHRPHRGGGGRVVRFSAQHCHELLTQ